MNSSFCHFIIIVSQDIVIKLQAHNFQGKTFLLKEPSSKAQAEEAL